MTREDKYMNNHCAETYHYHCLLKKEEKEALEILSLPNELGLLNTILPLTLLLNLKQNI